MRHYSLLVSAAMAASFSYPSTAQDAPAPPPMDEPMAEPPSPAQIDPAAQAQIDSWPPEQQAAYASWPVEAQEYYWSLPPYRQDLFWRISDADKLRLSQMTADEQAASWEALERNAAAAAASPPETDRDDPDSPVEE